MDELAFIEEIITEVLNGEEVDENDLHKVLYDINQLKFRLRKEEKLAQPRFPGAKKNFSNPFGLKVVDRNE